MDRSEEKANRMSNLSNGHRESANFKSSRLSMGTRAHDIVAVLNHNVIDESAAIFCEHVNRADKKVFTIKNSASGDVQHVGTQVEDDDGFDYALAFVNKRTKQVSYRPVSVVQFEAKYRPPPEIFTGEKSKIKEDFKNDFSVKWEDKYAKRDMLTVDFGSSKKNKGLDSRLRRKVEEHTLETTAKTALSAAVVKDEKTEFKEDGSPNVSLLQQAESQVLPLPNLDTKRPAEVYSLDQFMAYTVNSGGNMSELAIEALGFFKAHNSVQKLMKIGVSKLVANRIGDVTAFPSPGERAAQALKMLIMSRIIAKIFKQTARTFAVKSLEELLLPSNMMSAVRSEFFGASKVVANQAKVTVSVMDKNKMMAHFLCMMVLFDAPEYTVPISPLNVELGIGESTALKLLQGLGCTITTCTAEQAVLYYSMRIARLTGPPEKAGHKRFRFSRK